MSSTSPFPSLRSNICLIIATISLFACSSEVEPQSLNETQKSIAPSLQGSDNSGSSESGKGGTLKRLWSDPPTLDPHLVTDTTSAGLIVEMFSGLVTLNSDLEIVPDLAESWDLSENGTLYTFKLREDIKFSDGSPITANDFSYSFNRAANPDTESPVAELYLGDIVGVQEVLDGESNEISGVKVIDDRNIQIKID